MTCKGMKRLLLADPVFDHAKVEDTHEGLITRSGWAVEEVQQGRFIQQPAGLQLACHQEAPYLRFVSSIDRTQIADQAAFAAPIQDLLGQHSFERRPRHGTISAAGDPHPARYAKAGLDDGLGKQRHPEWSPEPP